MSKPLPLRWLWLAFLFAFLSCESNHGDPDPTPPISKPLSIRTIRVRIESGYDLRHAKVYSMVDSLALDKADNTLTVPSGKNTVLFLQDQTSQEIVAVVRVDTTQQEVVVNAASVSEGLQDLLPAYAALSDQQQAQFAQEAASLPVYQAFMAKVVDLLKRQQPIYSTEASFVQTLRAVNSHLLKTYLGNPKPATNTSRRGPTDTKGDLDMTEWVKSNEVLGITSQVHSYAKATFAPLGGGTSTKLVLEPQSHFSTRPVTTSIKDIKDGYYTLYLNQSDADIKSKNWQELAKKLIEATLGHILDLGVGGSTADACVLAMANNVALNLGSALSDKQATPQEMLSKAFPIVGKGFLKGLEDDQCHLFSLEKLNASQIKEYRKKVALVALKKLNFWATVLDAGLTIYEFGEAVPFLLATTSPLDLDEIMQVYLGEQRPAYIKAEKKGSLEKSYPAGKKIFPVLRVVPKSYYDTWKKSGFKVSWKVDSGNGSVNLANTTTGEDGEATVEWTLPTDKSGEVVLTAELKDAEGDQLEGSPLRFAVNVTSYNYKLQIGDYNTNYDLIKKQMELKDGDHLTVPNYCVQMVRLTLDDVPVRMALGLPWQNYTFGSIPTAATNITQPEYKVTVRDLTNNREVTITLNVTLTNKAYARIVGRKVDVDYGGSKSSLQFLSNGTYTRTFSDGSNGGTGSYSFSLTHAYAFVTCKDYMITNKVEGAIDLHTSGPTIPSFIMINEGGSLSANSFYACKEMIPGYKIE